MKKLLSILTLLFLTQYSIGQVIPQKITVLDAGGSVDTTAINNRINLKVDSTTTSNDSSYYWANGTRYFGGLVGSGTGGTSHVIGAYGIIVDSSGGTFIVKADTSVLKSTQYLKYPIYADGDTTKFSTLNLPQLRYTQATRDTTTWTDSTLVDRKYLNTRIGSSGGGTGGGGTADVKQTYTGSSSVLVADSTTWLIINPTSLAAAITITMPAIPKDKQKIEISFGGTITSGNGVVTSLTVSPNTGQSLIQASTPSYIQSGETISYRYNISNTSYYRIN